MKLSDKYKVDQLLHQRERLRTSVRSAIGDEDIKIEIQGREAQGDVRGACLAAISDLYRAELETNTLKLKELGVEVDDPPITEQSVRKERRQLAIAKGIC